jgi:tetratricopeptide (TPR) repeat protein
MDRDKNKSLEEKLNLIQYKALAAEQNRAVKRAVLASRGADNAKWITRAVQPHFEKVKRSQLNATESRYPVTVRALFDTAAALVAGEFGDKLKDSFTLNLESETHIDTVLRLLLFHWARVEPIKLEIFDKKKLDELLPLLNRLDNLTIEAIMLGLETLPKMDALLRNISVPSSDLNALQQLFHQFVNHCLYPSHRLIEKLLQMDFVTKAMEVASGLKNSSDKIKSYELIITYFLAQNDTEKAIELFPQLTTKPERTHSAHQIVDSLLTLKKGERAISFALSHSDSEERDHLLREIGKLFIQNRELEPALAVIGKIQDPEIQDYAKSNIVHLLARQNQFQKAKEIALTIQDRGYREDAILDIVKAYILIRHLDDAIQFVGSFSTVREKDKPAKLISAAFKSFHQDEKMRQIRKFFSSPVRRIA